MQLNTVVLPAPFGPMTLWMLLLCHRKVEIGDAPPARRNAW